MNLRHSLSPNFAKKNVIVETDQSVIDADVNCGHRICQEFCVRGQNFIAS